MLITKQELEKRKKRILRVAFDLFCKHGIEKAALAEIARTSMVSENSIYRYYGTKTNLLLEALAYKWNAMLDYGMNFLNKQGFQAQSGHRQVELLIDGMWNFCQKFPGYIMCSTEAMNYLMRNGETHRLNDIFGIIIQRSKKAFITAIEKGHHDGTIQTHLDKEQLFWLIYGTIRSSTTRTILFQRLLGDQNPWQEEQFQLLKATLLAMLQRPENSV